MTKNEETVLYLSGKKGLSVLDRLLTNGYAPSIGAIVIAQDKGVEEDYSEQINNLGHKFHLKVLHRTDSEVTELRGKYAFAIGWRWLISESSFEMLVVLHDSLLPKYRGFAPLVAQLINGERRIGVTAIRASSGYDQGPILSQESVGIEYPIKIEKAIEVVSVLYARQVEKLFLMITRKATFDLVPQDETEATYSIWRDEEDLSIDWSQSSNQIKRFVDATGFPYKGAQTSIRGKRIVVSDVDSVDDLKFEFRHVGKTVRFEEGDPVVICGDGLIKIKRAKWEQSKEEIVKWPKFRMRFT